MTPCRTEKVDFSPKKIKQSKTEKPKKQLDRKSHQKKQESNKQKIIIIKTAFSSVFVLVFVSCFSGSRVVVLLFFSCCFLEFGFLFFLGGFCSETLYSVCCWGHKGSH